jgi:hypothetical protein
MNELAIRFRITNSGRNTSKGLLRLQRMEALGTCLRTSHRKACSLSTAADRSPRDEFESDIDEQGLTLWTWSESEAVSIESDQ